MNRDWLYRVFGLPTRDELADELEAKLEMLKHEVQREYENRVMESDRLRAREAMAAAAERIAPSMAVETIEPEPERPFVAWACSCGCKALMVDVVLQQVDFTEDGVLERRTAGASVTCPRCGRQFTVDEGGSYEPHMNAWPGPWHIGEQARRNFAAQTMRRESAVVRPKRGRPDADMRRPPP